METYPTYTISSLPSLEGLSLPYRYTYNLGCFAGKSVKYFKSKRQRKRAIQLFAISEIIVSLVSFISLILAGFYIPAILTALMTLFLIYATTGVF